MSAPLSVADDLTLQAMRLGFASLADALAGPVERQPLWGDPVEVGDRVHLCLRHITAVFSPIGVVSDRTNPMWGGVEATTAGRVVALVDDPYRSATVEWDDGRVQTLAVDALMQSALRQSEAVRFHAGMLA